MQTLYTNIFTTLSLNIRWFHHVSWMRWQVFLLYASENGLEMSDSSYISINFQIFT